MLNVKCIYNSFEGFEKGLTDRHNGNAQKIRSVRDIYVRIFKIRNKPNKVKTVFITIQISIIGSLKLNNKPCN